MVPVDVVNLHRRQMVSGRASACLMMRAMIAVAYDVPKKE
jgi:hypothetical protein